MREKEDGFNRRQIVKFCDRRKVSHTTCTVGEKYEDVGLLPLLHAIKSDQRWWFPSGEGDELIRLPFLRQWFRISRSVVIQLNAGSKSQTCVLVIFLGPLNLPSNQEAAQFPL